MQEHVLDLSKTHWQKVHGDITVYGTWIMLEDRWQPCLVLIRTGEERGEHTIPCVVPMDNAWIWSEQHGDVFKAVMSAIEFAELLRLNHTDKLVVHRIITIVHDHIGDLISIPPRPFHDPVTLGEFSITNKNTGKSRDILITESS